MLVLTGSLIFAADSVPAADPPPHIVVVGNIVRSPGAIPYKEKMTVVSAISAAGGYGEFGGARIYLIRDSKSTTIDLREISRNPEKDIPLKPWDIIYIRG